MIKREGGDVRTGVSALLDEVERLRAVLRREHEDGCSMLRRDVPCDCSARLTYVGEFHSGSELRAEVERLKNLVAHHLAEIARLDSELNRQRRVAVGTPQPTKATRRRRPQKHVPSSRA